MALSGGVAQLGERLVRIQEAVGSNPIVSTSNIKACGVFAPGAFLFLLLFLPNLAETIGINKAALF